MEQTLTQQELDERVAILQRFRSLLEKQRNKFREYLHVLEQQQDTIANEDGDGMLAHTELETQILEHITGLQKVIVPVQSLYQTIAGDIPAADSANIEQMQDDLERIRRQVLNQNEKNRELLRAHIKQIRSQLDTLMQHSPYRGRRSIYAENTAVATGNMIAVDA
ncbi:MAG: flagellar protein FlgN [Treponemataceae bacterium]|nr:flagellar protein FlgN [Treponemataceae bacterium]